MYSEINLANALVLWLCLILVAVQFALALAARRVEAEQGLRRTPARLLVSGVILLLAIGLVGWSSYLQLFASPDAETGTTNKPDDAQPPLRELSPVEKAELETLQGDQVTFRDNLKKLKEQQEQLKANERKVASRIYKLKHGGEMPAEATSAGTWRFNVGNVAAIAVPILAVLGAGLLLLLGDPRTLIPRLGVAKDRSERRQQATSELDEIAADVDHQRYAVALRRAEALDGKLL